MNPRALVALATGRNRGRLGVLAAMGAGVAAGYALERAGMRGLRPVVQRGPTTEFEPPEDCEHRHIATKDGGELHLLDRGRGRPIVLLHGVTLSNVSWHYQILDLAEDHRVLAVDTRGHGDSKPGDDTWGIEGLATDLVQLLEALDLRDVVLVGHSMGGMAALQLAVDHPDVVAERVAGLVLVSTAAGPMSKLIGFKAVTRMVTPPARHGLRLAGRIPGGIFPSNDLSYLVFRLGHGHRADPAHVELNRTMTAATPLHVLAELLSGILSFDLRERLDRVKVPALVIVGTRDILTPPSTARAMADGLPDAELVVLRGAGHMVMLERADEVSDLIRRFSERVTAAG